MVKAHRLQVDVTAVHGDGLAGQQRPDGRDRLAERGQLGAWQRADLAHPSATPWPKPGSTLPGNTRSSAATSIAAAAGLRSTAGMMPRPTAIRSLTVRAAPVEAMPPA
jgi:hypothetical protein